MAHHTNGQAPKWVEVVWTRLSNRGHIAPYDEIREAVQRHLGQPMWRSYYTFDSEVKKQIEDRGAHQKHFTGHRGLGRGVVIDIDRQDLSDALSEARDFVRMLRAFDVPDPLIRTWFSGKKGFHIQLDGALFGWHGVVDPEEVTATLDAMDLSVDTAPTHPAGLIRLPWTPHQDTGLYKVPLTASELLQADVDAITGWAKSPGAERKGFTFGAFEGHVEPLLEDLVVKSKRSFGLREEKKPDYVTCMWHLYKEGPTKGKRHDQMMRLITHYAQSGLSEEAIVSACGQWLAGESDYGPDMKANIRQNVRWALGMKDEKGRRSRYSCDDRIMDAHCDRACIFYRDKHRTSDHGIDSKEGVERMIEKLCRSDDVYVSWEGFNLDHRILMGEVATIIGDTGLGKTSIANNLAMHNPGLRWLFYSPELPAEDIWQRQLQIEENWSTSDIKRLSQERPDAIETARTKIDHLRVKDTRSSPEEIEAAARKHNANVLVIDPLEGVEVPGVRNSLDELARAIRWCKDVAKRLQIAVLVVHHVNKAGQRRLETDRGAELNLSDAKGVKTVTEESNLVYSFEGQRFKAPRTMQLLKKTRNDVKTFTLYLTGDEATWRFYGENVRTGPRPDKQLSSTSNLPK